MHDQHAACQGGNRRNAPWGRISAVLCLAILALEAEAWGQVVRCLPVTQRTGEIGCWVTANQMIGQLPAGPVSWHLDTYLTQAEAEAAKRPGATVVKSLGKVWLLTVAEAGWRPFGGERAAEIGPLPVTADAQYAAQYLEAIVQPGMKSIVHRHGGPEVWYTATLRETLAALREAGIAAPDVESTRSRVVLLSQLRRRWRRSCAGWRKIPAAIRDRVETKVMAASILAGFDPHLVTEDEP
jgi:hypothetical protein